jgi:hyperosmotically inducible periplasmic protein
MRNRDKFSRTLAKVIATTLAAGLAGGIALAQDQGPVVTNNASIQMENLSAHSEQHTVYASPAERANDAVLITEVKASLAEDGVADGYPITVDAAHGVVTLTGVLGSQQDVAHAIVLARGCDGVKDVQSRLTTEKGPAKEQ